MEHLHLLVDLHKDAGRQGPGGEAQTRMAIALSALSRSKPLKIADIGAGTGAAALVLARELDADIAAVDLIYEFLAKLDAAAARAGLANRIITVAASMEALPFGEAEFKAIWSWPKAAKAVPAATQRILTGSKTLT